MAVGDTGGKAALTRLIAIRCAEVLKKGDATLEGFVLLKKKMALPLPVLADSCVSLHMPNV